MTTTPAFTLTGLKVCQWASEETLCFTATLRSDGKIVATVGNDGHGGCHFLHPKAGVDYDALRAQLAELEIARRPDDYTGDNEFMRGMAWEAAIDHLVTIAQARADLRRALKRKVLFTREGHDGLWAREFRGRKAPAPAMLAGMARDTRERDDVRHVLNLMPEAEALDVYVAAMSS